MKNIVIGISDCSKFTNYESWIKKPHVEILQLGYKQNNIIEIEKCDGILLTGGQDVNPRLYNQPEFLRYVNPKEIDEKRDEFEWKIMQHTEDQQKPLLGICRGLQFVNVFFGGTLVPDLPAFGKFNHSKFAEGKDKQHIAEIDNNSLLYKIVGKEKGEINSAHHQSVDMPGFGLVANAMSPDGVIEGMERRFPEKSFLMLVQWHPERMENPNNIFSKNIKQSFLDAVRKNVQ